GEGHAVVGSRVARRASRGATAPGRREHDRAAAVGSLTLLRFLQGRRTRRPRPRQLVRGLLRTRGADGRRMCMPRRVRSGWVGCLYGGVLAIALGAGSALAQQIAATPQQVTHELVSLGLRYRAAARPRERVRLRHQLRSLAAARQQLLGAILETDPSTVMDVALPAGVRASLPRSVRPFVEGVADLEGELEVTVEDRPRASRIHHVLKTDTGTRLALHFAADPPQLQTGSRVRVHGVRVKDALALTSGTASVEALSTAASATFGAQKTVVILVN